MLKIQYQKGQGKYVKEDENEESRKKEKTYYEKTMEMKQNIIDAHQKIHRTFEMGDLFNPQTIRSRFVYRDTGEAMEWWNK